VDSLHWSRSFPVLSVSRQLLQSLGIPAEHISQLTDEDMEYLALDLRQAFEVEFAPAVVIAVAILIADKEQPDGLA
jgi:hypothetical protein